MSKFPYIQFFTGDWLKDPSLSLCAPATRGVWIDLVCAMHESGRSGSLRGTIEQLARLARCSTADLDHALTDLQTTGAADVSQERNGAVTIVNRRMKNDADKRKSANDRQLRHRSKAREDPVTDLSRDNDGHTSNVRIQNSEFIRTSTSTSNQKIKSTSTHDDDAQIKISEDEVSEILEDCRRVTESVPMSRKPEQNRKDRSLVFKAVVLSRTRMSQDWLEDSLEAVRKHPKVGNKVSYFHSTLASKCDQLGKNFNQLLKLVEVPEFALNPNGIGRT